jgi:hemerythrin
MSRWNDSLATGNTEIDSQHQEIFRRVDELLGACKEGKGRQKVGETIGFLAEYVVKHFAAEERIQQKHAFPRYPEHKAMHERFIKDFGKLKEQFEQEGPTLSLVMSTNKTVVEWLLNHIEREDKQIAAHIKASGKA